MKKTICVAVLMFLSFVATSSASASLSDGLVAHWSFDNCDARDDSGNGLNGTIEGAPECIQGVQGMALRFNKVDSDNGCGLPGGDYIVIPTIQAIWNSGFTVCAWAKFEGSNRNQERIIDFGNGRGDFGGQNIIFGRVGTSGNFYMETYVDSTTSPDIIAGGIVNNTFRFYCGTINNPLKVMKLYVDGDEVHQLIGREIANVARDNNFIGHSNWCFNDVDFKGIFDEIYVYNRDLSASEIKELMSGGCTATFDAATSTLHIPCLKLENTMFWLDLGINSGEPLLLNIKDYGIK